MVVLKRIKKKLIRIYQWTVENVNESGASFVLLIDRMYSKLILIGLSFVINGDENRNDDRHDFESIVDILWRYPSLKQTLIHSCHQQVNKCKNPSTLRLYTRLADDEDVGKLLHVLTNCFRTSSNCRIIQFDSCSFVTCPIGKEKKIERDYSIRCQTVIRNTIYLLVNVDKRIDDDKTKRSYLSTQSFRFDYSIISMPSVSSP